MQQACEAIDAGLATTVACVFSDAPLKPPKPGGSKAGSSGSYAMAGLEVKDVDVAELYDCYTFTVLMTLEDYGFCAKGEAGAFVESGATARGGALPTNTGGGQLSSFYMWGMTPLDEGPHVTAAMAGVEPHEIKIGEAVCVDFEPVDDEIALPVLRRSAA